MITAIITCAGSGERAGFGFNKLLKDMGGITPFEKVVTTFSNLKEIDEIIITYSDCDKSAFEEKLKKLGINAKLIRGGSNRSDSVKNGLQCTTGDTVLIHDGARAFVSETVILNCIKSVMRYGTGITAIPSIDTVADTVTDDGVIYIDKSGRNGKYSVQTPQGFKTELLLQAYKKAKDGEVFPDESSLYGKYMGRCAISEGSSENIKLTYKNDFKICGNLFAGTGFDLHVLVENRKLILGGIEIPHNKGLLGHSDADVLTHAIMDALLSSASLGDIGKHFPDTDDKYKGISSILLLRSVMELLRNNGFKVKNVSAVIMAQKPKLMKYVENIKTNLAKEMGIESNAVGITCTTLEGIGTVGREEGIAVQAYCLTEKVK